MTMYYFYVKIHGGVCIPGVFSRSIISIVGIIISMTFHIVLSQFSSILSKYFIIQHTREIEEAKSYSQKLAFNALLHFTSGKFWLI